MKEKLSVALQNKTFFIWGFRASAGFLFLSVLAILFVLIEVLTGSVIERYTYIMQNQFLVFIAWSSTFIASFAICFVFTMLLIHLKKYRPILQCAWFICIVAFCASVLYHLIEGLMMPNLYLWFIHTPFAPESNVIANWDVAMSQLARLFIPTSFSIGGLIYTAVMFRVGEIPLSISCWSLGIWTLVLLGSLCISNLGVLVFFLLSVVVLLFVPWVWQVGQLVKKIY